MAESNDTSMDSKTQEKIQPMWKDPALGLTGVARFQEKLRGIGINVPNEKLKALLAVNPTHNLFTYYTRDKKWK